MFSVENNDRKEQKKVKKLFQTNVRSQQMKEGAVAAASHLPSASWLSRCQAGPAAFSTETLLYRKDP